MEEEKTRKGASLEETKEEKSKIKKEKVKKEKIKKDKKKSKISKQTIILVIAIIAIIAVTVVLIVYKFKQLDEKYKYVEDNGVFETENKVEDEDKKYALKPGDVFNPNDIVIEEYYLVDGQEYSKSDDIMGTEYMYLVRISGLKDKNIENEINQKILNNAQGIYDEGESVYVRVTGNFSNILSIEIRGGKYPDYKYANLNFDLNTGEEFTLEDVFIKSAPIVSILYNGFAENLAWNLPNFEVNEEYEYWEMKKYYSNMENRDTSDFEEYLFKVADTYKRKKGNIQFTVSNGIINVYNLIDDPELKQSTYYRDIIKISMEDYMEYIAIYHRYEGGDLYENSLKVKNIRATFEPMISMVDYKTTNSIYEEKDNYIVDVVLFSNGFNNTEDSNKKIYTSKVQEQINKYKELAANDKGYKYIIQGMVTPLHRNAQYDYLLNGNSIEYNSVGIFMSVVKISLSEPKNNLETILCKTSHMPKYSIDGLFLSRAKNYDEKYENIVIDINDFKENIQGDDTTTLYYDVNWNYLGDDIEVVRDTSNSVYNPS